MYLIAAGDVLAQVDIECSDEVGRSRRRTTDHNISSTASRSNLRNVKHFDYQRVNCMRHALL